MRDEGGLGLGLGFQRALFGPGRGWPGTVVHMPLRNITAEEVTVAPSRGGCH